MLNKIKVVLFNLKLGLSVEQCSKENPANLVNT